MKICTKCHEEKALDEFNRCARNKGGRQSWCKTCAATYRQSARGKALRRRYDQSAQRKASQKRYQKSAQGNATIKRRRQSAQSKAYQKRYQQSPRGKAAQKKYSTTTLGKETRRRNDAKYRKTAAGRYKDAARKAVSRALKTNKLTKGPCAICGATNGIQAHHPDYSNPLDVEWYCRMHHDEVDALTTQGGDNDKVA